MSKESPEIKPKATKQKAIKVSERVRIKNPALKILVIVGLAFGFFFFGQVFPVILLVTILSFTGRSTDQITDLFENSAPFQMAMTLLIATFSTYLIWQFLRWRGHKPSEFLLLKKIPRLGQVGEVILTYGVYFITLIIASVIVSLATPVDVTQQQDLGVAGTAGGALIFTFVMLVVVPPIYEELLFRGFLYRYISTFGGRIIGYTLTSILFGIAHLEFGNLNWIAAIDTLIFSAFLIYISQKHQSLYSAMLLHAMKNGIAFYVLFIR